VPPVGSMIDFSGDRAIFRPRSNAAKKFDLKSVILDALKEARSALDALLDDAAAIAAIDAAGQALIGTFRQGGRVFSCGNGGSLCDAVHFAEELTGRYRLDRKPLAAVAIADSGHLSCVANDFGYDQVFSRFIEAHGRAGDCLLAISTSGNSRNVLAAAATAKRQKLTVIGLTGRVGCPLGLVADIEICTPGGRFAERAQELHLKIIHILIELVERELFPENYAEPA
jgi:D-sedoheptulose 7-phosphate isomerase